jgi:hypothetical protein
MGKHKCGSHYVTVRTALSNIRITTFFAGKSEVEIIDLSSIQEVQSLRM